MVRRIETLTTAQAAHLDAHVDAWIEAALRTSAISRRPFTKAARRCHELAGLPWHGNVVWVSSPLVLALAAPLAALLIPWHRHGLPAAAVNGAIGAAVGAAVRAAADNLPGVAESVVRGSVQGAINAAVEGAAGVPGRPAVRLNAQAAQDAIRDRHGAFDLAGIPLRRTLFARAAEAVRRTLRQGCRVLGGAAAGMFRDVHEATDAAVRAGADAAQRIHDTLGSVRMGPLIAASLGARGAPFQGLDAALQGRFLREVCGLELSGELEERAIAYELAVQAGGCWCYPHLDFLMVCDRPVAIHRELVDSARPRGEGSHRLHRNNGPAMSWADGWGVHVVHGRRVPGWIIEQPEQVTVAAIEEQSNAEVRRIMLERYGLPRFMRDCGAQLVDECGPDHPIAGLRGARLLRKELLGEPEPLVYLQMINSTPEPDGSFRTYLERIDPKAYDGDAGRLCHAAMASRWCHRDDRGSLARTFERWQDYRPDAES
jgi:hypothetical protein